MKNNLMSLKTSIFILISVFSITFSVFAKEVKFKAFEIKTFDEGSIIVGEKNAEAKIDNE